MHCCCLRCFTSESSFTCLRDLLKGLKFRLFEIIHRRELTARRRWGLLPPGMALNSSPLSTFPFFETCLAYGLILVKLQTSAGLCVSGYKRKGSHAGSRPLAIRVDKGFRLICGAVMSAAEGLPGQQGAAFKALCPVMRLGRISGSGSLTDVDNGCGKAADPELGHASRGPPWRASICATPHGAAALGSGVRYQPCAAGRSRAATRRGASCPCSALAHRHNAGPDWPRTAW